SNLFEKFDENGVPLKLIRGEYTYFYTKIFTYALAAWHRFLLGQTDKDYRKSVLDIVGYICKTISIEGDGAVFRNYEVATGAHTGRVCGAMEQGIGITLLCIGYELTGNKELLSIAEKALVPYHHPIEKGGVVRYLDPGHLTWYEEFPTSDLHVLNGCLDSLLGPFYLFQQTKNPDAIAVFKTGIATVELVLPMFDNGIWSNYYISEAKPPYIASMKYHMIHVYQLQFLGRVAGSDICTRYAQKFEEYSNNHFKRIAALVTIAWQKRKVKPVNS
ncbi:MAG: hypothetical protein EOO03_16390, partial [Chitinophagaceae bacterium]